MMWVVVVGAMVIMVMMLLQMYIMCIPIAVAGAAAGAAANITANVGIVQSIETSSCCCSRGGTTKDAAAPTGGVNVHIAQHLVSSPLSQWVLVMSQASRAGWRMVAETLVVGVLS